jgi:hypothetical protein
MGTVDDPEQFAGHIDVQCHRSRYQHHSTSDVGHTAWIGSLENLDQLVCDIGIDGQSTQLASSGDFRNEPGQHNTRRSRLVQQHSSERSDHVVPRNFRHDQQNNKQHTRDQLYHQQLVQRSQPDGFRRRSEAQEDGRLSCRTDDRLHRNVLYGTSDGGQDQPRSDSGFHGHENLHQLSVERRRLSA